MARTIEVCFTPDLISVYKPEGKLVVVIDVLRATSCMVTAFQHGIKAMIPVASVEECKALQNSGLLAAAERDGKMVEGFDLDNSPFSYMNTALAGKTIAVTTTNGTTAIAKSTGAAQVLIGCFLNRQALVTYLAGRQEDILLHCAGWKGKVNLEDSLFAGALIDGLTDQVNYDNDSAIMALELYRKVKDTMFAFLQNSSHARRLSRLNIVKDIEFCIQDSIYEAIPILEGAQLVPLK